MFDLDAHKKEINLANNNIFQVIPKNGQQSTVDDTMNNNIVVMQKSQAMSSNQAELQNVQDHHTSFLENATPF